MYSEFDGEEGFVSPDDLFAHPGVVEFIIAYGEEGLDHLSEADPPDEVRAVIEEMVKAGLLERDEDGRLRPTARMVKGMQHRALLEIFRDMRAGVREGHASQAVGRGGERTEGTRGYQFGDPLSELAVNETLRNAMGRESETAPPQQRSSETAKQGDSETVGRGGIRLRESDFEVHNVEASGEAAVCVLIDLSGSMARYGRHIAAKKVALGLRALVRERFPLDTLDFIGFATVAEALKEADLPLVMPRPIDRSELHVRVRAPLAGVLSGEVTVHEHFTNLHHGLRAARATLMRRGAANRQVFIITDGEPTAHLSAGKDGVSQMVNLIYPPSEASAAATLEEALRCARAGIRISTFALIEEYHAMDWVGFVERMTRLTRGVAYYCTAGDLASTIMESYLKGKRERKVG